MKSVLLVGNPNSGKTTLFNALTGEHQRVGNWPGVTVEKKEGTVTLNKQKIHLIDLPGLYSLSTQQSHSGIDEQITARAVTADDVDLIINVIDACQLERHLYLTSQLLEIGKPILIVLNMMDLATSRGIKIDVDLLSKQLHCPIIQTEAHQGKGKEVLLDAILNYQEKTSSPGFSLILPPAVLETRQALLQYGDEHGLFSERLSLYQVNRLLEKNELGGFPLQVEKDLDMVMADARYTAIHRIVLCSQKKLTDSSEHLTAKIDKIVLHRFWALPIFIAIMYLMFFFAIHIGGAFQDFFDIGSEAIFVQGTAQLLQWMHAPHWMIILISSGIGKGINTTCTFIPVIASMFFFLSLLETSGYMARAAFVIDKVMRLFGLPGKAFIPMIIGFGCNVPAVMATRTLDSERDRLLTILMSPFMSCSARLAIYAIFVVAFFPVGGHNIVFSLYLIGILMAIATGLMLRKLVFHHETSPLLLELPIYHRPSIKRVWRETTLRLRYFVLRAGKLIIPVCAILGGLNAMTLGDGYGVYSNASLLSVFGRWITPLFAPLGLTQDNWPAAVGLLSGTLAKEVVIGTLQTLYAQVGHLSQVNLPDTSVLLQLKEACHSISHNFSSLHQSIFHPLSTKVADSSFMPSTREMMVTHFDGRIGAYAYLLFILLYIPCVSTMAVIRQEAGSRYMWFSIFWSLFLAYGISVGFYQIATVMAHPLKTLLWSVVVCFSMIQMVWILRKIRCSREKSYAIATS